MAKARSKKKRLNKIEGQLDVVKEELGEVKHQVTNDIPHKLEDLRESNVSLYNLVNENAQINSQTLNAAMKIVGALIKYTPMAGHPDTE